MESKKKMEINKLETLHTGFTLHIAGASELNKKIDWKTSVDTLMEDDEKDTLAVNVWTIIRDFGATDCFQTRFRISNFIIKSSKLFTWLPWQPRPMTNYCIELYKTK